MLILSRKIGEAIVIDRRLFVRVVELLPNSVRVSVTGLRACIGPANSRVYRDEGKTLELELGQGDMVDVDTYIYCTERDRNRVKLGIDAPRDVIVLREELD